MIKNIMLMSALAVCVAALCGCKIDETMSFEPGHSWSTAPLELTKLMEKDGVAESDMWSSQSFNNRYWKLNYVPLHRISGGLKLSDKYVKDGDTSGLWQNLPVYPTIATDDIPRDWSKYNAFSVWIYANRNTGDTIYAGIMSDGARTLYKDYYMYPFKIDFQGWKKIVVPFNGLKIFGSPDSLNNVDALYFFSKAYGHQPNPYLKLYLDKIELIELDKIPEVPKRKQTFLYGLKHKDKINQVALNHPYPEKAKNTPEVTPNKFITHQTYHQKERALYKYYPRFEPGYVSFSPQGRAYVFAGDVIQYLDKNNQWQTADLKPYLVKWAKKQGWAGVNNNWGAQGSQPEIRFDKDGNIYVLATVSPLRRDGRRFSWKMRTSLLLYSRDNCKSFQVYKLPGRIAAMEKMDGHNQESLERPPVIMMGDYKYFGNSDKAGYMLLPKKKADGTLDLSNVIKYSENCIGVNYHSGDGNIVITSGGKIYIVYAWAPQAMAYKHIMKQLPGKKSKIDNNWTWSNLKKTALGKTVPPIPENHPGMKLSSMSRCHLDKGSFYVNSRSCDGTPSFIRDYDLKTKKLSDPVYLGSAGGNIDGHNWPAITVDSKGILHVILNGHHNPTVYTHSLNPGDITKWSIPGYVQSTTDSPALSYGSLNCDKNDTLYTIHRSTSGYYNNRLTLFRKKAGGYWEPERTLVAPFKGLYLAWRHRVSYDPARDRLVLNYYSNASQTCMSRDMYEFLIFYRPEQEPILRKKWKKLKKMFKAPYWDSWVNVMMVHPDAGEITSIITSDGGDNWNLVTTADLRKKK
jgi:BNR repeat-containing family member/Carbohydrate binding domain (family 11)